MINEVFPLDWIQKSGRIFHFYENFSDVMRIRQFVNNGKDICECSEKIELSK